MTTVQRSHSSDVLLAQRADRISAELELAAADGWLVYDFRGSNPAFARLLGDTGHLQSTRRAFLYLPRHGRPRMLIHHVDAGNFLRLGLDVLPYGGRDQMLVLLTQLLHGGRRVLMEYSPGNAIPYVSRVDAGTLDLVRSLGLEVLSSADALASVVAAWDDADVQSHTRAAQALERCKDGLFAAIRDRVAAGDPWTEYLAQQHQVELMKAEGLEFDHPPVVAVGPHAGDPHYAPSPELALPIRHGELVLNDLWAREAQRPDGGFGAYADITWMATVSSTPAAEHLRIWDTIRQARDAALGLVTDRVRLGQPVMGGEVDRAARDVIVNAGYGPAFTHRTGHSIGWSAAHGDGVNIDDFETHDTRLLRPGASFSIEPGIYLPDFGVRSEINVVITTDGSVRVTTPPQTELVLLA